MSLDRVRKVGDCIKKFNLYAENENLSQMDQFISTRLFTFFLFFSILIIILSTSFISQTNLFAVDFTSEDVFKQLSIKYRQTLSCLCQQSSIIQDKIVSFHPEYHPICSSQFINQTFLLSLTNINISKYWPVDYRLMISSHIQFLEIFCRMTKEKIDNVLQKFSSQYLITIQVLSSDNFQSQTSTLINQFQQNTITAYKHINDFIWFNTFYNRILSGLRSNFYMRSISDVTTVLTNQYGTGSSSCTCRRDDKCTYPAYIYNYTGRIGIGGSSIFDTTNNDPHVMFILPNTRVGCYPYQSLLTSTFECFYDQSCLDSLQKLFPEFSLLSPLKLSRYSTETSINDLLNNLFIESWNEIYNFSKYYEIYSPK